jgi:hypothetical protein
MSVGAPAGGPPRATIAGDRVIVPAGGGWWCELVHYQGPNGSL